MGNKATTLSPTESIQDLLSGAISLSNCTCEEIATHLGIVIFLGTHIATGEIEITTKQMKDLIQVYGIILKMIEEINSGVVHDSYSIECLKKALQAIIRLLVIPQISKRTFEQSYLTIVNNFDCNNFEVFSISFVAFFNGFRYLEEKPLEEHSLRALGGVEETLRNQICLQLDKIGIFSKLIYFLTQTSAHSDDDDSPAVISILICRFISWILNRASFSLNPLKTKLRQLLLQHQETLYEFIRHKNETLSDATITLLIQLLDQEDRTTCLALQVILR